jgi:diguanylate cyclase (GGDEF)-like protein/PAS domain S-box-containing protein
VTPALVDQIIERSPIGIAVIDFDGIWRSVNPAYCTLYGYSRDEMVGHDFTQVFAPDQRDRVLAMHRRFLSVGGELRGEWEVARRDGRVFNILSESVRVPGEDGRTRRLVYVVDITERKQVELALTLSQCFVQSVLDSLTAHVCVIDECGVIVAVNQAWRAFATGNDGMADQLSEGVNYLDACTRAAMLPAQVGNEGQTFGALLADVLAGRVAQFEFEYSCHSPDQRRWFLARASRIAGSDPLRVVVAHDNVTELKQAQESARQGEAMLLDLAASIPGAMFRLEHRADVGWRFSYFSPGLQSLFELTPDEACRDTQALRRCILAGDLPAHDESIRAVLGQGTDWEHEYRIRTASGRVKWINAKASRKVAGVSAGADAQIWTGVLTDVTDRKHIEAELKASEATYRTLFETVPQGVVYHDAAGHITSANPAAQRILGLDLAQLQGLTPIDPCWHAIHEDGSAFAGEQHPAMEALRTAEPVRNVVMGVAVPGQGYVWILVSAIPLFENGRLQEVYASFEDITQRVMLARELRHQASTDALTGASNRRSLMERLRIEFDRVQRHPELHCSLLAVDLDHFKLVNDRYGHAAGDAVLRHVTQLMRQDTRQVDVVARSGGEEFSLLLPDTSIEAALALAERLRKRLESTPTPWADDPVVVTASVGVSVVGSADISPDDVLARADLALYAAKHAGRNVVRCNLPSAPAARC